MMADEDIHEDENGEVINREENVDIPTNNNVEERTEVDTFSRNDDESQSQRGNNNVFQRSDNDEENMPTRRDHDHDPLNDSDINDEEDEDGPQSSVENILPLKNLRNGWFSLSSYMTAQAIIARDKAIELNNSESVKAMKLRASESYDQSVIAARPYYEKAVEVSTPAWEKAKEIGTQTRANAGILSDNMRPSINAGYQYTSTMASTIATNANQFIINVSEKKEKSENIAV